MWIATAISVFGSMLNAKKSKWCFYVWILANVIWLVYDIYIRLYSRATLDIIQTVICISGIIYWNKSERKESQNESDS